MIHRLTGLAGICLLAAGVSLGPAPTSRLPAHAAGVEPAGVRSGEPTRAPAESLPVAGRPVPALAAFDRAMLDLMARWQIPGGALAVAKDGRLVLRRGYGWADWEAGQPVEPNNLFRIASVSKPITAIAILKLVEEGRLHLADRAFERLGWPPPPGARVDPRLAEITIQHLLQHAGGWNSTESGDPQYLPGSREAAWALDAPEPTAATTIVRFMIGQPLDFTPGSRTAYSNFGYNVLGRVIEQVTGQSYEEYVRQAVLEPMGIRRMQIAGTRLAERAPGEVRYYPTDWANPPTGPSVYPGEGDVPLAYGAYYLPATDAHGGWIASAEDLARFATAIDGHRPPAFLQPETVRRMLETPIPGADDPETYAGTGNRRSRSGLSWIVEATDTGYTWSHAGAYEGSTAAWLIRRSDGVTLAVVFNALPDDFPAFFPDLAAALTDAGQEVGEWPQHDFFRVK